MTRLGWTGLVGVLVGTLGACDDGGTAVPAAPDMIVDMARATGDAADMQDGSDMAGDAGPSADMGGSSICDVDSVLEDVAIGDWRVEINRTTGGWAVFAPHSERAVLRSAATCVDSTHLMPFAIHRGAPRVTNLFGAFRFEFAAVEDVVPTGHPEVENDGGVTLRWDLDDVPVELRFEAYPDGGLWIGLRHPGADGGTLRFGCAEEEGFFGLGTQVVGPNLRGRTYPLWTQEQGNGKPENGQPFPLANVPEAAYAPMGIWHSSAGYTAVIGHDALTMLDLCDVDPDQVQVRSHAAMPSLVLMPGASPKARLTAATGLVGRPTTPPDWVLAPWNDTVGGPERLNEMAAQLRALDIPSSAIWTEDWIGGFESPTGYRLSYAWAWDRSAYPDLPTQIDHLHAEGFAFLGYFNSFVPDTTRMWAEGQAGDFLIKDAAGDVISFQDPAFRTASLVDLYNPLAVDWLEGYLRTAAVDLKIDGWMADFSEWLPVSAVAPDGSTGWTNHNPYPLRWNASQTRVMNAAHAGDPRGQNDWAVFVRAGWASINGGSAATAGVLWAGDQNTNWQRDDGFPTIIPIGIHAGLAGVAWFATDVAGYNSLMTTNTSKELFFRWASAGAFLPVMRTHHGGSHCDNWSFERDAETIAHYRRYARIHTLLFPFLRALGDEASATGVPIMRHGYLVEPTSENLWAAADQYFLGDDMLVAPIVEEGATRRRVMFPVGDWWPLLGDTLLEGAPRMPWDYEVTGPPTEVPVFVRAGTILPLLGDVVDSFYGAQAEGISDLSDVAEWWRLALYPTVDGELFEIEWGGTTAAGMGMVDLDWSLARVDDVPLADCEDVTEVSCRRPNGVTVFGPARLTVGGGWLTVGPGRFDVYLAGDAFGEDALPTSLMALDTPIDAVRRICPDAEK